MIVVSAVAPTAGRAEPPVELAHRVAVVGAGPEVVGFLQQQHVGLLAADHVCEPVELLRRAAERARTAHAAVQVVGHHLHALGLVDRRIGDGRMLRFLWRAVAADAAYCCEPDAAERDSGERAGDAADDAREDAAASAAKQGGAERRAGDSRSRDQRQRGVDLLAEAVDHAGLVAGRPGQVGQHVVTRRLVAHDVQPV